MLARGLKGERAILGKSGDDGWIQIRLMGDESVLQSIAPDLAQQVQPNKRDKYGNQGRLTVTRAV